jgi:hypothetical protein
MHGFSSQNEKKIIRPSFREICVLLGGNDEFIFSGDERIRERKNLTSFEAI